MKIRGMYWERESVPKPDTVLIVAFCN